MISPRFFAILAAVSPVAFARVAARTATAASPGQTEAFLSAQSYIVSNIFTQYESLFDYAETALPSSVFTDYLSTEPNFDLASFAEATTVAVAPWISLLPGSIKSGLESIATKENDALESAARSILGDASLASQTAVQSAGSSFGPTSIQFSNTAATFAVPTGGMASSGGMAPSGASASGQMTSQATGAQQSSTSPSRPSTHNAAPTAGVNMVHVAGAALGAAVAAVAAL